MHRERPLHSRALLPRGRPLCRAPADITERQKLPSPPSLASPTHCPPLALPHANAENGHGRRELEFGRRHSPTSERFTAQQPPPLPSPCLAPSRAHARPSYWPPEQRRRLAARLHATGVCGQSATAHLWPSRRHTRVRTTPLAIPRHSTAEDEQPPAATASSDGLLCFKIPSGTSYKNSTKFRVLSALS